jgi:hypothetical protein
VQAESLLEWVRRGEGGGRIEIDVVSAGAAHGPKRLESRSCERWPRTSGRAKHLWSVGCTGRRYWRVASARGLHARISAHTCFFPCSVRTEGMRPHFRPAQGYGSWMYASWSGLRAGRARTVPQLNWPSRRRGGHYCGHMSADSRNDAELLEAWRGGDQRAGEKLFDRHAESVARFFENKTGDRAEDLVQATFLRMVRAATESA